jgi:hypothetical protein
MVVGIELERVRRRSGGRIHLTPHVPDTGSVVTLCDQTLAEGTYEATELEADCRNCLRRKNDPGRVSSAFFQSDAGAELLRRSLEEARARPRPARPEPPADAPAPGQPARPRPAPPPPEPDVHIPELRSRTSLRKTFERVYVSPDGVILRLAPDGSLHEIAFSGAVDIRRRGRVLTVKVGDVVLEFPGL